MLDVVISVLIGILSVGLAIAAAYSKAPKCDCKGCDFQSVTKANTFETIESIGSDGLIDTKYVEIPASLFPPCEHSDKCAARGCFICVNARLRGEI